MLGDLLPERGPQLDKFFPQRRTQLGGLKIWLSGPPDRLTASPAPKTEIECVPEANHAAVRQWPREIPINGTPADVHEVITAYGAWLEETPIPKLLLHATPGGIIRPELVEWAREHLPNLQTVDLGEGIHYLQEDHPDEIGAAVARWYGDLKVPVGNQASPHRNKTRLSLAAVRLTRSAPH